MSERINKWLPWINVVLLAVVIIGGMVIVRNYFGYSQWFAKTGYIIALPSYELMRFAVTSAVYDFSGTVTEFSIFAETILIAGSGLLLILVVAPFLLMKGYQKTEQTDSGNRTISWYTGAVLITTAILMSATALTMGTLNYGHVKKSIENNRVKDQLRYSLINLAVDVSNRVLLPQKYGGGNGSFNGFVNEDGLPVPFTLGELEYQNPPYNFEYVIHEETSDSALTIIGVSEKEGQDPAFKNINGETGKQQVSVTIHPHREHIFSMGNRLFDN